MMTLIDEHMHQCLVIKGTCSLKGEELVQVLVEAIEAYGRLQCIRSDKTVSSSQKKIRKEPLERQNDIIYNELHRNFVSASEPEDTTSPRSFLRVSREHPDAIPEENMEGTVDGSHPDREAPEVLNIRPNLETEAVIMQVLMDQEMAQSRQVDDVDEKDMGNDVTSLDLMRLIEDKGFVDAIGRILITPNDRRIAKDRRDCYWFYIVTNCGTEPKHQYRIPTPAHFDWNEVTKVAHYHLLVNALTQPMQVKERPPVYGENTRHGE